METKLIGRLTDKIAELEEFGCGDDIPLRDLLFDCRKELQLATYQFDRSTYVKLPTQEKPKCQARVYIGVGKMRECNRTASHSNKYCFSHKNYNQPSEGK